MIGSSGLFLFLTIIFLACKDISAKKESWAVIINFFSPDTSYYPETKKFPFPDSLQFATLEDHFTNQDKGPMINDSAIIYYSNYNRDGQRSCCIQDTLETFTDTINGKKYLFAIGEYVAVFLSNADSTGTLHKRRNMPLIPLWNIQLNTPYPPGKFKVEYEKLGAEFVKLDERIDEVYRQKWNDNDSIFVETIQFANSTNRIITQVYKDMNQQEVDSTINYLKKLSHLKYNEVAQPGNDTMLFKAIKMSLQGISISIIQTSADQYSFTITDYYETIKFILKNAGTNYIFRDDLKIY